MNQPTVIVTGASRGLGAAVAQMAVELGARVVLSARSEDQLKEVAQKVEAAGGTALAVRGDVSREEDCRVIIDRAMEKYGRIDALVNNAGTIEPIGPVASARWQEWERNWAINVLGPVMLIQMALPSLRQTNGRIINITSGTTESVVGGWGAYSSAKTALNHLTRILASEEPAVTTLAVHPGVMDTEMQATIREKGRGNMAERNYHWLSRQYETGQLVPPELSGRAVACLALYAPHEWSGEILTWNEVGVQQLVQTYFV